MKYLHIYSQVFKIHAFKNKTHINVFKAIKKTDPASDIMVLQYNLTQNNTFSLRQLNHDI